MAEICCEEAKSTPATASAVTVLARRRPRVQLSAPGPCRPANEGGGKRRRVACAAASGRSSCRRPGAPGLGSRWWPRYGVTSVCGLRREMEDAVSIRPDFLHGATTSSGKHHHFFGVFDGHGCCHVARMCQDKMHELIADEYGKAGSSKGPATGAVAWKEAMEKGFARMDDEASSWAAASRSGNGLACRCERHKPARCDHAGSTAVVAVVGPDSVVVASAGDSRAVLSRGGVPVPLSIDHKPDRPDELDRIQKAGGRVIFWDGARVLGVLAMSRAIGDGYLKPFVTAEPEVTVTERTDEDECLILASDGLWDVVSNEMACNVVRACFRSNGPPSPGSRANGVMPPSDAVAGREGDGAAAAAAAAVKGVDKAESDRACADAALLLTKLALARRSSDNVSVVVVDLRRAVLNS
ncbi:hypothetical protein HU200_031952 [Digitaria exilis]|uniref:protein-serine/threonine phosphatase n=1 Tax=Digitaria exilis TaxID=1010633 RepID=A0A835EM59_9POAL|nr:hypothetical protein HU200_031952 [Digitaria exilis]CAB3465037.1 unnamed protein product [Digitaria exilis]